MPILDTAAEGRSLDNDYGPTRGPNSPSTLEAHLFMEHPSFGGVEVSGGGYAPVTFSNDAWDPSADGVKRSHLLAYPAATGEYPDTVTHVALRDPATGIWWDCVPLEEELDVTGPGSGPEVVISIYYNDNTE